jgi:hypothetical protein
MGQRIIRFDETILMPDPPLRPTGAVKFFETFVNIEIGAIFAPALLLGV